MNAVERMEARGARIAEDRARALAKEIAPQRLAEYLATERARATGDPASRAVRIATRQAALYARALEIQETSR